MPFSSNGDGFLFRILRTGQAAQTETTLTLDRFPSQPSCGSALPCAWQGP